MKIKRVPIPEETPVEVVVSGRTSTLKRIKVVNVGNLIPVTFSNNMVRNTPGFRWFVSQHYALKTDFSTKEATEYLTMLELAYPHYIELFGKEIPELRERRMACVYGKTRETLIEAMLSDGMNFGYGAGGITQEGFFCAYQSPSNVYHSRYILVHECVHLYEYCLNNRSTEMFGFFVEGVADYLSSHVYEPVKKRLTVNVLDRAPMHNFFEYGKKALASKPRYTFKRLHEQGSLCRGTNVLMTAFLQRTPEHLQKFRVYRDEMFRKSTPKTKMEVSRKLVNDLYGSWGKINKEFAKWVKSNKPTFHMVDWGFDQDGNKLISFGTPQKTKFSQMNINLIPSERPRIGDFKMDYRSRAVPKMVGPVKRGVAEPSIGCVVDFSCDPGKGMVGLGLGRRGTKHLRVLIDKGRRLIVDGTDLGMKKVSFALSPEVCSAIRRERNRAGMTIKIGRARLEVTIRAGQDGSKSFIRSVPISKKRRERLVSRAVCVLGRGARHIIIPFMDDGRALGPNVNVPAPANRWRNIADQQLFAVYKACWRLGKKAPRELVNMRKKLLNAVKKGGEAQKEAIGAFEKELPSIAKSIYRCGAKPETINRTLAEMAGLSLSLLMSQGKKKDECEFIAVVSSVLFGKASGKINFASKPSKMISKSKMTQSVRVAEDVASDVIRILKIPKDKESFCVEAELNVKWYNVPILLKARKIGNEGIPRYLTVGPFDTGGKLENVSIPDIEKIPLNLNRFYTGQNGQAIRWQKIERDPALPMGSEHLVHMIGLYGQANHSCAFMLTWVDVPKDTKAILSMGVNDGIVVQVNGKTVHSEIKGRDWSPKEDLVRIHLNKGRNKLLFKLIHGGALWLFSAALTDENGWPITGLKTTLDGAV